MRLEFCSIPDDRNPKIASSTRDRVDRGTAHQKESHPMSYVLVARKNEICAAEI